MAKTKSSAKVSVITGLFILAALIFCLITIQGVWRLNQYDKNLHTTVSDAPGLCYDESNNGMIRDNSYPCYTYTDASGRMAEVDDDNDRAIFLYDKITFTSMTQTMQLRVVMITICSMFSVASLLGGIIYFCHNKS